MQRLGHITIINHCLPSKWQIAALLLLVLFNSTPAFAQDDYSGVYYIDNNTGHNGAVSAHYYLIPADDPMQSNKNDAFYSSDYSSQNGDPEKPFLTTYKTNKDLANVPEGVVNNLRNNSVWILKAVSGENGYYYIIHASSGKYVVYDPPHQAKPNRKSVHLLATDSPDENAKFNITTSGNGYNIRPKTVETGNRFFNPSGSNQDYYHGNGGNDSPASNYIGTIGLWSGTDGNSIWYTESTLLAAPVISDVDGNNTFTIADSNYLPPGYTIRYTTGDGTQDAPTATTGQQYSGSVLVEGNWTVKAVVVRYGIVLTETATKNVIPVNPSPVISFDNLASKVSISCTSANATVYYNTGDGSQADPTSSTGTLYENSFSVTSPTTVKAIAIYSGNLTSQVAALSIAQVAAPTIQDNGNNAVSITSATADATIYYTTDGSTPTTSSTEYTGPLTENISDVTIKAIAVKENMITSAVTTGSVRLQCATPVITRYGMTFSISCNKPTGAAIYYSLDNSTPAILYNGTVTFTSDQLPMTVTAVARHADYNDSESATFLLKNGDGTQSSPYLIYSDAEFADFISNVNSGTTSSAYYKLEIDISAGSADAITTPFTGMFDGDLHTISNLHHALFNTVNGGTVKNVILDNVTISEGSNVGAICNEATGATRIYNCGVLATTSSTISGSGNVGGLVGTLSGNARVINCYSYANVSGGNYTAGIVGYNSVATTQNNVGTAGMVMNCMFYGDITGGSNISPVYGGQLIDNAGETGINNYNYYRRNRYDRETDTYVDDVTFDNDMELSDYHRSWPADAKYLTRFEYYRSILNSNKRLCTYWITGKVYGSENAPTQEDEALIAKWVLDPAIAPYPILKKWGKYPSVINQDPDKRIDPTTKAWVDRDNASDHWGQDMAPDTEGQNLGTVTVTINGGDHYSGSGNKTRSIPITAMDTENNDYCYGKIQLPYYNEIFGDPDGNSWDDKYGGNYKDYVVTGWDIAGGSAATDYNFADRNSYSGRVYAQGGYFYVPNGVTSITITAHWADAVYLCNKDHSIDRVNVASGTKKADKQRAVPEYGSPFTPAGTIPTTFQGQTVYTTIQDAIKSNRLSTAGNGKDVYNQAIVLIGNVQVRNHSYVVGLKKTNAKPFTIMSADLDFDNEPDNCLELQFRNDIDRPGIQPIRFDFLPVTELGLAIRTNNLSYAIGLMIPLGHFEITETAFMHTTQFEYDGVDDNSREGKSPVIINGGEHEMFTVRKHASNRTSYFLLGGNAWIHRFAPGAHPNTGDSPKIYLCPINVIGGEIKELYLSGLYRPELTAPANQGNPYCFIDGGKFGTVAGAGYDNIAGNVTFKIDHSLIEEFYGGGINGTNPIGGNIDVTINNSLVDKFCGGPKVGDMTGKTVTTSATGTTFGVFYGGGNGGNSYYRQLRRDGDMTSDHIGTWTNENYDWNVFAPLEIYDDGSEPGFDKNKRDKKTDNKGYHAEYEFEVFNQSNGLADEITQRGFIKWIQFGITTTGNVESTLNNCKVLGNFYGGGNLASVSGNVTSTLTNTQVNGNAFGAGYSAAIPTFQVHDKDNKTFPSINDAGVITDGYIPYDSKVFEWTNDLNGKTEAQRKADPTYQKDGKWYCYTWNSLENLGVVTGNVTLNIEGNTLVMGIVTENGRPVQSGGVFGGGDASGVDGNTQVNIDASSQKDGYTYNTYNVFGGGNKADVGGNVTVDIESGTIENDVYGGGALANTNINNVTAGYGTSNETIPSTSTITTTVNLKGGTIKGDAYGGGLGSAGTENVEAKVYGDVTLYQLGTILVPQYSQDNLATAGRIFGCNNVNGTPKGHVLVYVSKTTKNSQSDRYALAAVYGGGNQAEYVPSKNEQDNSESTEVIIDGCDNVTIHSVYGGGNAASTPATDVKIRGSKEIEFVYGGGNGAGTINGQPNPGANVGYRHLPDEISAPDQVEQRSNYQYGSGLANTEIYGGTIHHVFGGSNTKGNVRRSAVARLEELGDCPLHIDEIYGGGRAAFMDGSASLELGCISGLDEIYGGSERADIGKDVVLTITSGKYNKVFGGNNVSGHIFGSITVNIEQTGCLPIEIGELYGGGNQAPYSVYGYDGNNLNYELQTGSTAYADPQINIKSFKSIGTVYGGGYQAEMVGNPHVNINVVKGWTNGEYKGTEEGVEDEYAQYKDTPKNMEEIGQIGTVFGGGNDADVVGKTYVNIGTESNVTIHDVTKDVYDIIKNNRTDITNPEFTDSDNGSTTKNLTIAVEGVIITGNVYGGGNNADVTDSTNIQIGPNP